MIERFIKGVNDLILLKKFAFTFVYKTYFLLDFYFSMQ
nr:MAG TPA: hypothetical protein [Caudoviricetes sp.]